MSTKLDKQTGADKTAETSAQVDALVIRRLPPEYLICKYEHHLSLWKIQHYYQDNEAGILIDISGNRTQLTIKAWQHYKGV